MINKLILIQCCINSELYFLFFRNDEDIVDIKWIKENIVDEYKDFVKKCDIDEWEK